MRGGRSTLLTAEAVQSQVGSVWGAMTGKRSRGEEASTAGDEKRRRTGDG